MAEVKINKKESAPVEQASSAPSGVPAEAWDIIQRQQKQIDDLKTLIIERLTSAFDRPAANAPQMTNAQTTVEKMVLDDMLKRKSRDDKLEFDKRYHSLSCECRSQIEANRRFKEGSQLWRVGIGWSPDVIVRGHDRAHCVARYNELCGIISVKPDERHPEWTTYRAVNVTNDPESRRRAQLNSDEAVENPASVECYTKGNSLGTRVTRTAMAGSDEIVVDAESLDNMVAMEPRIN
jgi:hypothetical protein